MTPTDLQFITEQYNRLAEIRAAEHTRFLEINAEYERISAEISAQARQTRCRASMKRYEDAWFEAEMNVDRQLAAEAVQS